MQSSKIFRVPQITTKLQLHIAPYVSPHPAPPLKTETEHQYYPKASTGNSSPSPWARMDSSPTKSPTKSPTSSPYISENTPETPFEPTLIPWGNNHPHQTLLPTKTDTALPLLPSHHPVHGVVLTLEHGIFQRRAGTVLSPRDWAPCWGIGQATCIALPLDNP